MADAGDADRDAVRASATSYATTLDNADVSDADVMLARGGTRLRYRLAGLVTKVVLLAPFAIVGLLLNIAHTWC